jgi:hypothetical protein
VGVWFFCRCKYCVCGIPSECGILVLVHRIWLLQLQWFSNR